MATNILNLPDFKVRRVEEADHDYHVYAEVSNPPGVCTACGFDRLIGHGRNEQVIGDLPTHGKRLAIYVDTRRWRCQSCGKTFMEALPAVNAKREMTDRLVKWIGQQSLKRTFASIADDTGLDEKTIRNIFRDYINELEAAFRFETPKWMGIDEIHLIKLRCVISNIRNNTIIDMLPNRDKKTVVNYLYNLQGKSEVQYVAMDMWTPYRDAVQAVLPDARIVIDKFHVVRMANDAVEKVGKSLREQLTPKQRRGLTHDRFVLLKRERDLNDKEALLLDGWTKNYPELGAAYILKESFYGIYEWSDSPEAAVAAYEAWNKAVVPEVRDAFGDLIRAFTNWRPFILNYFEHPVTNAYTESLNSLIRVMNRLGLGLLGISIYHVSLSIGLQSVASGPAAILIACGPVFVALMSYFLGRERLSSPGWLGIAVAFLGAALIAVADHPGTFRLETGALLILLAALATSVYFVFQRGLVREYGALRFTVYSIWAGTLPLLIFLPGFSGQLSQASTASVWGRGISGRFPQRPRLHDLELCPFDCPRQPGDKFSVYLADPGLCFRVLPARKSFLSLCPRLSALYANR